MGVMHHRRRVAARIPEGGGITEPSLTDTATDDDILEHDSGEGPAGLLGSVDIDWDDTFGPFGTRSDLPPGDPYTVTEAREDASEFAEPYLPHAKDVRNVAQDWQRGTVTLNPGAPGYEISGDDPLRKSIEIRVVTGGTDIPLGAADVYVGERDVLATGGSSGLLMRSDFRDIANNDFLKGDDPLKMTHTGEVWIIPASGNTLPVTVAYFIERYTK